MRREWCAGRVVAAAGSRSAASRSAALRRRRPPPAHGARELVMAYDDAQRVGHDGVSRRRPTRASFAFSFPTASTDRCGCAFRPRRRAARDHDLRQHGPGDARRADPQGDLRSATEDLSDGKDGRWVVEDLVDMKPRQGRGLGRRAQDRRERRRSGRAASCRDRRSCATTIRRTRWGCCRRNARRCCASKSRPERAGPQSRPSRRRTAGRVAFAASIAALNTPSSFAAKKFGAS